MSDNQSSPGQVRRIVGRALEEYRNDYSPPITEAPPTSEEAYCHWILDRLRRDYERAAEPYINRLVRIKQMDLTVYRVSLPPNLSDQRADQETSHGK